MPEAGPTRSSLRPAIHPAGETPEIWAGTAEASALPDGWNHPYFYFCGIYDPGDSRLLGADCGRLRKFRDAGPSRKKLHIYNLVTDYAATVVFLCMVIPIVRRLVFKPARYAVPEKFGKAHTADAIFLLALIAIRW